MNAIYHARKSVAKYGGQPSDYIELHNFLDSSKATIADNRHRAILHSSFGIFILEKVFGVSIVNSDGREISVRQIGEDHVLEDFKGKFIPTVADYLSSMTYEDWMHNGAGVPPSARKLFGKARTKTMKLEDL